MKQQNMYIAIIAIVIAIGVGWYLYNQGTFEETETEQNNVFDSDFGSFKVDLYANLEDGRQIDLTNNMNTGGDITYDQSPVESLTYTLSAAASTSPGSEPFDAVTVDLDSFRLNWVIEEDWSPYEEVTSQFSDWGSATAFIPQIDDGVYYELDSWTFEFSDEIVGNGEEGDYSIIIFPTGMVEYCGSDASGSCVGEKLEMTTLPSMCSYIVNYTLDSEVIIVWNHTVTWS